MSRGFPGGSDSKESAYNGGRPGFKLWAGKIPAQFVIARAIHSSILAWTIPWTEKPGGLQSMGHNESDTIE